MRYIALFILLVWTSISSAQTMVLYVNGILVKDGDPELAFARIQEILQTSGFSEKFDLAHTEYTFKPNPSDGVRDLLELQIQAANSSRALTSAKANSPAPDTITAASPEYKAALGKLYFEKIEAGAGDREAGIQVYSIVKNIGRDVKDLVIGQGYRLIVVAHSQGNFFAEAIDAYIRYTLPSNEIAILDDRLRFVGAASVAASTPNGRYISASEDKALDDFAVNTSTLENFNLLPRNSDLCSITNLICYLKLLAANLPIHGFLEIYSSKLVDQLSGKTLAYLLAKLISDSFDEITAAPPTAIQRVSIASDGTQGNGEVWYPTLSANGRYVAFMSSSSNLVPGDTNGAMDIFVHDRQTRQTTRVSVASDGTQVQGAGNFDIERPSISADGRFVAFTSSAHNLVTGDTNGVPDVFVHDRQTGQTTRVSVASDGTQANVQHPYGSRNPSISSDGRFVAFTSAASNLVLNDVNGFDDVFVRDRQTGTTTLVSVSTGDQQGNVSSARPSISADGLVIAFESAANNLLDGLPSVVFEWNIFVRDRVSGVTSRVDVPSDGDRTYQNANSFYANISADGRFVAFESSKTNLVANDTNAMTDVFVHDQQTGITTRVSVASNGTQGNSESNTAAISGDGRFVVFTSPASNLVGNDGNGLNDVYLHDRQTASTSRVSIAANGSEPVSESFGASISSDGRSMAFVSAGNLVESDTNGARDVYAIGSFGP